MGRVLVGLVALALVGCGQEPQEADLGAAKPDPKPVAQKPDLPSDVERAVRKHATDLYYPQRFAGAGCEKSGFAPGSELFTCVLRTADGEFTEPSEWAVMRYQDGSISGAFPTQ